VNNKKIVIRCMILIIFYQSKEYQKCWSPKVEGVLNAERPKF
jgi:hypothetical protein